MYTIHVFLFVGLSFPALASSQLEGHFHLSKEKYSAGEPVFLVFKVENQGTQPVLIETADPLSFCGGYSVEVEGAKKQESFGCYGGVGGSCLSSSEVLKPGATHIDRMLLNQFYDLRHPGTYSLHVSHDLPYGPGDANPTALYSGGSHETFDAQLEIVLEASADTQLKAEFQRYLLNIESRDSQRRTEAAQVITDLAPVFLENTILQMLDSPDLKYFAVRGLRNLGTSTAHQALVSFVANAQPSQEVGAYQEAIRYLGEIGDGGDVTVLLGVAHENPNDSYNRELAMESVGKVGGDNAVPLLVAELRNPSVDVRQSAVRGLYLTGSRRAVPVLIELLRSPEIRVSQTAEFGLEALTHRSSGEEGSGATPAATYAKWVRWWHAHGDSATMFKDDQCGDKVPLE
jgi:hypothetical protein